MHKTKRRSPIHDTQSTRRSPNPNARHQGKILKPRKRTQEKNPINTRASSRERTSQIRTQE
jgi:hypothetical protein